MTEQHDQAKTPSDAPTSTSGMPKWFAPVFAVALLGFGASLIALLALAGRQAPAETGDTTAALFEPSPGLETLYVPEFSLVDQSGQPVDESLFDGNYTLLSFVFTNCVLVCPDLTGAMYELYSAFGNTDARFVSMSVDPVNDTPEVLSEYAGRYGIDSGRWRFLTGEPGEVERVARDGMKFELSEDPSEANQIVLDSGSVMSNIVHPSSILLIGPDRRVLGRYRYQFPGEIQDLRTRLGAIMAIESGRNGSESDTPAG